MDKWEYRAELLRQSERQREQMNGFFHRNWLALLALPFGIVGVVFVGLTFRTSSSKTESSGHLWWKDESTITTEIPLSTRLVFLFVGLVLLAVAALCAYLFVRRTRRQADQRKYVAILTGIETMSVHQVAAITNTDSSRVYRDIQRMIDAGLLDEYYVDYTTEQVVSKKYVPKSSHKTVVTCRACGANNELIVGITRACVACGEPLVLNAP